LFKRVWEYFLIKRSGLFDPRYYCLTYPDIRRADRDPLLHYVLIGWKEGRDPSSSFSTKDYLEENPDVKAAGVNPLLHFIKFGLREGRQPGEKTLQNSSGSPGSLQPAFRPKVTVIVPNYNHSAYLEKRLSSIFSQTYRNFDVVLLDDCSTDNSRAILEKYRQKYPSITRLELNEKNSGNVFFQWKKGMALADAGLLWIAESDDYCDPDFLEKLVPYFEDESILLAYAHSIFVDEDGSRHNFTFEKYLADVSQEKWNHSYVETAHNEVKTALGLRNSIPNVSSVVFRKPDAAMPLLNDPAWLGMKICGDWVFYLHLLRGGRLAYNRETNNYFRIHEASSSKKTHTQDVYYQEHEAVACAVGGLYNVPEDILRRNHQIIQDFYLKNVDGNLERFNQLYDINKVFQARKRRTPNILIGIYAFWFGGGEVLPIRLANAFKEKGLSVLLFDAGHEEVNPAVRKLLSPSIPVIHYGRSVSIEKILSEFGIEIVHTHHAFLDLMFSAAKAKTTVRVKHAITMHGMYEMMGGSFERNVRRLNNNVDVWFYIAEKNLDPFKAKGFYQADRFFKIGNGMKPPVIQPVDLGELGIGPQAFTACVASRALPEKGWMESIEAVKLACQATGKDIHLLLIGEGPLYEELKGQALPENIHLLGFKSNVVDYLAASQVGLVPSYFPGESFPLVVIESFMAGRPVIASRIGEIPNMIMNENISGGILIDRRFGKVLPKDISSALVRLIENPQIYSEYCQGAQRLKDRFNIDRIAEEYLEKFCSLLEKQ
jgi:glycosyltransferase involved in cell wall biosynthesis